MAAFHVFGRENGQTVHLNTYRERSAAMACCAAKVDASKARRPMVCVWAVSVGASLHDDERAALDVTAAVVSEAVR